jgi:WW domain
MSGLMIGETLPLNWQEGYDPNHQRLYYWNRVTNESSWTKPEHIPETDQLPADWVEIYDKNHNRNYYFNRVTKESSWDRPVEVPTLTPETDQLPANWVEIYDNRYKRNYYFNRVTKESSWTKPEPVSQPEPVSVPQPRSRIRLNVFDKKCTQTASYIYTVDADGVVYFGLVRKVPANSRTGYRSAQRTGAAGTSSKYYGKWTNVGGSKKNSLTELQGAIDELNDEAGVKLVRGKKYDSHADTRLMWMDPQSDHRPIVIKSAYKNNNAGIFLIEMKSNAFFDIFPKFDNILAKQTGVITGPIRVGQDIVDSSQGEIDAVASFNMTEIVNLQKEDNMQTQNNFFISYFCKTFNDIIMHDFQKIHKPFYDKWAGSRIPYLADSKPRTPTELTQHNYR